MPSTNPLPRSLPADLKLDLFSLTAFAPESAIDLALDFIDGLFDSIPSVTLLISLTPALLTLVLAESFVKAVTKDVTPSFPTFFSELEKFDKTLASFPEISSIAFNTLDMLLTAIVNDSGDGILLQNVLMDFANPDNFFPNSGSFSVASPKSAFANLDSAVMPFTDALTVATLSSP